MRIVIPMAGLGSRFPRDVYGVPKPMIPIGKTGKPMIQCAIESLGLKGHYEFIVNQELRNDFNLIEFFNSFMTNPYSLTNILHLTEGAADTCLFIKNYIDNDEPLIITNCDQIMEWDSTNFNNFLNSVIANDIDGAVVTYPVLTEKNSYVSLDENGYATEIAEKKIISKHSLNGIHFWKRGSDFVRSAENMIKKNIRVNNEFYIAPTYNEMILEGKRIVTYPISVEQHWAVGTPEDLQKYLEHANI
jgi:NDP-sugar pyrophosphorylase family protein